MMHLKLSGCKSIMFRKVMRHDSLSFMSPRPAGKHPTLLQVAQAAGTSVPTVSKVLRGGTDVSVETRARVMDAVQTVGYTRRSGNKLDGESIYNLLEDEQVTFTAAVPTVWLMLLQYMQSTGKRLSSLKRVAIGGSACPRAMIETFEKDYGVTVSHAWGMTEMSPIGTIGTIKHCVSKVTGEALYDLARH